MFSAYLTPRPQWRLLNLVELRTQMGQPRIAFFLLDMVDADATDVAEQVNLGMLRASAVGDGMPLRPEDLSTADLRRVRLSLTVPGARWVRANPHNKALIAVARHHRASVARVLAESGVDFWDLGVVIDVGLVTLTFGQFGTTPLSTRNAPHALTDPRERERYFCTLTPTGRRLVDPS